MRNRVLRWLSFLAVVVAAFWIVVSPGPESGLTGILVLAGFVSTVWPRGESAAPTEEPPGRDAIASPPLPGGQDSAHGDSLLVLPFRCLSVDGSHQYLGDGLTEEIIVGLSGIPSLRVISHASAVRLKGSERAAADLARELGVSFVLEGTIRVEGTDLRVTARLVDARGGNDVWADRMDSEVKSILALQRQISQEIVEAMQLKFQSAPGGRRGPRLPQHPQALEAYLRARYELWGFSKDSLGRAIVHLESGLRVAGDDEALLGTLGQVYTNYAQVLDEDYRKCLKAAAEVAERIFALNPDSPYGHQLVGWIAFQEGRLRDAGAPLERAWRLDPTNPETLLQLGYLECLRGNMERGKLLLEELAALDPLTPVSQAMPGMVCVLEGRFGDALEYYERAYRMAPAAFMAWAWGWALLWNGRVDEAAEVAAKLEAEKPDDPFTRLLSSLVLGFRGRREEALAAVAPVANEMSTINEFFSRELAHCYAVAGDATNALFWLEKNIDIGNLNYPFVSQHDRFLDNVRDDPRFQELVERQRREWAALRS